MNPIEHVWDALGRRVAGHQPPPQTLQELDGALLEEWDRIPQLVINSLIDSMPQSGKDPCEEGYAAEELRTPSVTALRNALPKAVPEVGGTWLRMARRWGLAYIEISSLALALDRDRLPIIGVSPLSTFEESSGGYTWHVRKVWDFGEGTGRNPRCPNMITQ
ncbi:transposable element Tcb2 transposase [Trichonephila clavipes]|nr:transposable element Tcb2 transposase [Trichonephila clavipes]